MKKLAVMGNYRLEVCTVMNVKAFKKKIYMNVILSHYEQHLYQFSNSIISDMKSKYSKFISA